MSSSTALGTAVRQAARFNAAAISWPAGLLAAIPVVTMLGVPIAAGDTVAGVTMGVGAMLVGVAWRTQGGRPPLGVMATDSALMALSTFVGCVTGSVLWVHIVVLALWSLMAGMLIGLGNGGGAVGTQAIIAVIVFGRFSEPAPQALGLAGLVLAGGTAQVVFLYLVRYPLPLGGQRRAAAGAYRALAELTIGSAQTSALPAATALDEAATTLASASLLGDSAVMTLRSLVDEGHRMRIGLTALNGLAARLDAAAPPAAELHAIAQSVAAVLAQAADVMLRYSDRAATELEQATTEVSVTIDRLSRSEAPADDPEAQLVWPLLARRLDALGGQLRAVATMAPTAGRGGGLRSRRPRPATGRPLHRLAADFDALRANVSLESPATRHALRLAAVVPLATLVARELPLHRGYWVVVAAAAVLRPEFGATWTRGTERAGGTALGVALAGLIAAAVHPAVGVSVFCVFVMAWLGYATLPASFAVGYAFITALVVFLLNVITPDTTATASARLLDTAVGAVIGLCVFAAWPTWARGSAQESLATLMSAQRRYLQAIFGAFVSGHALPANEARDSARAARLARTQAESLVARSLGEPPTRRIDARVGAGMLGELRRLIQTAHVLRLDAQDDAERAPMPELAGLARAVDLELAAVARALQTDELQLSAEYADLRTAYGRFADAAQTPSERALLPALDELVDAANGVAELVARRPD